MARYLFILLLIPLISTAAEPDVKVVVNAAQAVPNIAGISAPDVTYHEVTLEYHEAQIAELLEYFQIPQDKQDKVRAHLAKKIIKETGLGTVRLNELVYFQNRPFKSGFQKPERDVNLIELFRANTLGVSHMIRQLHTLEYKALPKDQMPEYGDVVIFFEGTQPHHVAIYLLQEVLISPAFVDDHFMFAGFKTSKDLICLYGDRQKGCQFAVVSNRQARACRHFFIP